MTGERMPFLKEVAFKTASDVPDVFPFTLPVIESLDSLAFDTPVTFFVGENGSGKSTLLEAIAIGMKCPSIGATDVVNDPLLADAKELAGHLRFSRSKAPRHKLFFRAEDAIGFTRRVLTDMSGLTELERHFEQTLDGEGRRRATGAVRGQRAALESRYGQHPDARSHGEWFLEVVKARVHDDGLYILDEPETPLSPIHQLTLLSLIKDQVTRNCQFIVATHSPILMALPGARILNFDQRIEPIEWQDVEHVAITRAFLNDPESFLRHL